MTFRSIYASIAVLALLLSSMPAMGQITDHGGTVIAGPQVRVLYEGAFPLAVQAQLTIAVKDMVTNPDPVLLEYAPGAAGTLISTQSIAADESMDTGAAAGAVQADVGPKGFINFLLSRILGRIGDGHDVWIIFTAPDCKSFTCNGAQSSGFHTCLTFRKGTVVAVKYDTFTNMTQVLTHELAEDISDPLVGNCWCGPGGVEIGDLCEWQAKMRTINGIAYTVTKLHDRGKGDCE